MSETKTVPVTTLKLLGGSLPEFDLPVSIQKLSGDKLDFSIRVKAHKKDDWAAIRDNGSREALEAIKATDESVAGETVADAALRNIEKRGNAAVIRESQKRNSETILKFAVSWPAEEPLSEATLIALDNEAGGSLEAILSAYDRAIYQGRLGNFGQ